LRLITETIAMVASERTITLFRPRCHLMVEIMWMKTGLKIAVTGILLTVHLELIQYHIYPQNLWKPMAMTSTYLPCQSLINGPLFLVVIIRVH
ncbi:hypothetical protein K7432_007417, partial [Basidiobolus ranarum]